jgi:hypothetical protein
MMRTAIRPSGRPTRGERFGGGLVEFFFFAGFARGPDACEGSPDDVLEAWRVVAGRLDGGAGFLDGVARSDAQGVLPEPFLEGFTRLVLEDRGFGE